MSAILSAVFMLFFALACTAGETVPIDLEGTVPLVEDLQVHGASEDVTAEGNRLAVQQCLDDPTLIEGVVRVVNPENDAVVAEFTAICAEVR